MADLGKELKKRYDDLVAIRQGNWDSYYRTIQTYVRQHSPEFSQQSTHDRGRPYRPNVYDGTAVYANQQLTSSLHSSFLNTKVFKLTYENEELSYDSEARMYLEEAEKRIHLHWQYPESYFVQSSHEMLGDLTSFGTGVQYQDWQPNGQHIKFRSVPMSNCYIDTAAFGRVDTIFVLYKMSVRAAVNFFGDKVHMDRRKTGVNINDQIDIIHCVYPNNDFNPAFPPQKGNKPYKSYWFDHEMAHVMVEGGYDDFPYHVPRWSVISGETMGRSPAMTCLSDVKMVNSMAYVIIKAAQKAIDPPLVVPNQGYITPLKTSPGSFLYKEPYAGDIQPLDIRGNHQLSLELVNSIQQHILRCFFVDYVNLQKNNIEMTAYEVQDRRNEQASLMAPNLGRVQAEWLQPAVIRSYNLLKKAGELPEPPKHVKGARIKVEVVSPSNQAFAMNKLMTYRRFLEAIHPIAAIDQSALHRIKLDETSAEMAELTQLSQKVVRTPEELAAYREEQNKAAQQAQQAQLGQQMASAYKDMAQGQKLMREVG